MSYERALEFLGIFNYFRQYYLQYVLENDTNIYLTNVITYRK